MRGAALPAALLFAVLAMTLSFAPRRAQAGAIAAAVVLAILVTAVTRLAGHREIAFAGCWISLLLIALAIHLPHPQPHRLYLAGGALAGFWAGAVIAAEGQPLDLARAVLLLLIVVPGSLLVARGWGIALKVLSSWAIAVALFAALLPTSTAMPGYQPDHMN